MNGGSCCLICCSLAAWLCCLLGLGHHPAAAAARPQQQPKKMRGAKNVPPPIQAACSSCSSSPAATQPPAPSVVVVAPRPAAAVVRARVLKMGGRAVFMMFWLRGVAAAALPPPAQAPQVLFASSGGAFLSSIGVGWVSGEAPHAAGTMQSRPRRRRHAAGFNNVKRLSLGTKANKKPATSTRRTARPAWAWAHPPWLAPLPKQWSIASVEQGHLRKFVQRFFDCDWLQVSPSARSPQVKPGGSDICTCLLARALLGLLAMGGM